jgi:glutamate racemase
VTGPKRELPIGVFDSGAGGLTVLRALRRRLPNERFLYFGDTAHLPYGDKSPSAIRRHAREACARLAASGVKMLVVACNTASAIALDDLVRLLAPRPVVGVVAPGAARAARAARRSVGLLATEATLRTGAYEDALHERRTDLTVVSEAAPVLVALAEQGWHEGRAAEAVLACYLEKLRIRAPDLDCLLLGCTHFPPFRPTLERLLDPSVTVVDSADATAEETEALLEAEGLRRREGLGGFLGFMVSDNAERFRRLAPLFLGENVDDVRVVESGSDASEIAI